MPPPPTHRPLILIVATTPVLRTSTSTSTISTTTATANNTTSHHLGIGLNGTLPWPRIKSDMSFFARVTTRPPRGMPPSSTSSTSKTGGSGGSTTNAIIMGRKTYDSLPKNLRPLAKRINVVITRDTSGAVRSQILAELEAQRGRLRLKRQQQQQRQQQQAGSGASEEEENEPVTDALVSTSLEDALQSLQQQNQTQQTQVGNIFVIGGGEIYAAALRLPPDSPYGKCLRIVMTKVKKKSGSSSKDGTGSEPEEEYFHCDTFFPLNADDLSPQQRGGWREVTADEVSEWVGEPVSPEWKDEGDVLIRVVGYERVS